jgi:hypothetical protein
MAAFRFWASCSELGRLGGGPSRSAWMALLAWLSFSSSFALENNSYLIKNRKTDYNLTSASIFGPTVVPKLNILKKYRPKTGWNA